MVAFDFNLSEPPSDSRQRELWLQHAIRFILSQDVRDYALQQVDPLLKDDAKAAATKAINDAVCGLMMVRDGVTSIPIFIMTALGNHCPPVTALGQ
jgi:hypothetical protein